jgi:hypothetical protein
MATGGSKELASNNQGTTTEANNRRFVGSSKLPSHRASKKRLVFVLFALVVLAAGWLLFGDKLQKGQLYAQAAGHKIYKQDVQDLIGKTEGISERAAAEVLADKYLTEAMAKEQGITISDKDIELAYGPSIKKQKTRDKYSYQLQVNQLYFDKLQAKNQGIYKGELLVAHFSRYIALQPLTAADKKAIPKMNDPSAIAQDKKYAEGLITRLYDRIKAGELTFAQAAKIERKNPIVGLNMYPALSHSGAFDTSKDPNLLLNAASIRQRVSEIKPGEITEPFVVKVSDSTGGNEKTFESYFLVVKMDETSGSYMGTDFNQYLEQSKKRLEYKIYV